MVSVAFPVFVQSYIFVASIGAYQSVNSCLAAAILAFFLCMILTGTGHSRLPLFQVTGGFLCAPKLFNMASIGFPNTQVSVSTKCPW